MRKIILFLLVFVSVPFLWRAEETYAQQCPANLDFETGTFSNWKGAVSSSCSPISPWTTGVSFPDHEIVSGLMTDVCGGFPVVAPNGGNFSARLGRTYANNTRERLATTFIADASNVNLYFQYATVLADFAHSPIDASLFKILIIADSIDISQENFNVKGGDTIFAYKYFPSPADPVWQPSMTCTTTTYYYFPWKGVNINLSAYLGFPVTLLFETSDCHACDGDVGYAYIDACGLPLSTVEIKKKDEITIYPNPTSGQIQVAVSSGSEYNIEIYNVMGEVVYKSLLLNPKSQIDLSSQPQGIYFLNIKGEKKNYSAKIVKY